MTDSLDMNENKFPSWDTAAAAEKDSKGRYGPKLVRKDVYTSNNRIFAAGGYTTESGRTVTLPGADDPMISSTKVYSEVFTLPHAEGGEKTVASCVNDDCLRVAREMIGRGLNPAVLNLADAYTACGWYYRGSGAQEESLCRASTLSRSLYAHYKKNRAETVSTPFLGSAYPLDMHWGGIYSPKVTVFREGGDLWHRLLEEPYEVSVVSVAALDFNEKHGKNLEYRAPDGGFTPEGFSIMQDKIRTIYRIALSNGHDSAVLGAFGCGAFRLPAETVAGLFRDILTESEFVGRFKEVRFAILEKGSPSQTGLNGKFAPFYRIFASTDTI